MFQSFNLFGHLTVMDNLTLAQRIVRNRTRAESKETALALLAGITDKADCLLRSFPADSSSAWQSPGRWP